MSTTVTFPEALKMTAAESHPHRGQDLTGLRADHLNWSAVEPARGGPDASERRRFRAAACVLRRCATCRSLPSLAPSDDTPNIFSLRKLLEMMFNLQRLRLAQMTRVFCICSVCITQSWLNTTTGVECHGRWVSADVRKVHEERDEAAVNAGHPVPGNVQSPSRTERPTVTATPPITPGKHPYGAHIIFDS